MLEKPAGVCNNLRNKGFCRTSNGQPRSEKKNFWRMETAIKRWFHSLKKSIRHGCAKRTPA